MSRILLLGAGGFIGSHLLDALAAGGHEVVGTFHQRPVEAAGVATLRLDILDRAAVEQCLQRAEPDVVFHLAAQSGIPRSWQEPETTMRVNVLGTAILLDLLSRAGWRGTMVFAGSSAEYGPHPGDAPLSEETLLNPASPYAVSKAAADLLVQAAGRASGFRAITVRPFAVIGPQKRGDLPSDVARAVVAVERGRAEMVPVGNLSPVRDFVDVQDVVEAMLLLSGSGPAGVYNIASGHGRPVAEVVQLMLEAAGIPGRLVVDETRLRPVDEPVLVGDSTKLRSLGWAPAVPLEASVQRVLDWWRCHDEP